MPVLWDQVPSCVFVPVFKIPVFKNFTAGRWVPFQLDQTAQSRRQWNQKVHLFTVVTNLTPEPKILWLQLGVDEPRKRLDSIVLCQLTSARDDLNNGT